MNGRLGQFVVLAITAAGALPGVGCSSTGGRRGADFQPLYYPDAAALPRVVIYGDLMAVLPAFNPTSRLDEFLFGPDDRGRTILRHPQGMALLGEKLLVCDQGYPDVVAIDLASGASSFFCRGERMVRCPVDVAVHAPPLGDPAVFVADSTARAVLRYDGRGTFQRSITPDNGRGAYRPCSVATDGTTLYIGDLEGREIRRFNLGSMDFTLAGENAPLPWFDSFVPPGGQGTLFAPTGLAVHDDGTLFAVDAVRGQVYRRAPGESWIEPIGRSGRGRGEFVRPKHVVSDESGLVLVTDAGRQSVQVFNSSDPERIMPLCEVYGRADQWKGWTLPSGLVSFAPDKAPTLTERVRERGWPVPDTFVVVSDSLGRPSLTLMGLITQRMQEGVDAP